MGFLVTGHQEFHYHIWRTIEKCEALAFDLVWRRFYSVLVTRKGALPRADGVGYGALGMLPLTEGTVGMGGECRIGSPRAMCRTTTTM